MFLLTLLCNASKTMTTKHGNIGSGKAAHIPPHLEEKFVVTTFDRKLLFSTTGWNIANSLSTFYPTKRSE